MLLGSSVKLAAQGRDFGQLGAMFLAALQECPVRNTLVGGLRKGSVRKGSVLEK